MNNPDFTSVAAIPVRQDSERCSYSCPFYQDGAVFSVCNRYHKKLKYDGKIPPLLCEECKKDMSKSPPEKHCAIIVPESSIPKGAQLVECYETETEFVIIGDIDSEDEKHNCDEMGCSSIWHVKARFKKS